MAIAFARPEYVSRSSGAKACCKSAYNARDKIKDIRTGSTYNFEKRNDNVYHNILLPEYVDQSFKITSVFANEVEKAEKRKDSQLYVEWLLALPKEENVSLELKLEMIYEFISRKDWVKQGLGVQIDIHKPHEGEMNWHVHLLVTTRRFTKDGKGLENKKASDLQPEVKFGKVQKTPEIDNNIFWRNVQNDVFKAHNMTNRVDLNGELTQEHIGPVRMRHNFNSIAIRNEEKRIANIKHLGSGKEIIEKVSKHMSVFSRDDLARATNFIGNSGKTRILVDQALSDKSLLELFDESGKSTGYYTTKETREEELKLVRLSNYVASGKSKFTVIKNSNDSTDKILCLNLANFVDQAKNSLSNEQHEALNYLINNDNGISIIRGRAGTGKSHVLGQLIDAAHCAEINVIGLAPTHKARLELAKCGYSQNDTIKGMLFKLYNGRYELPKNSLIVVDEAGMVGNDDYQELLRIAASYRCNIVLSGDERQLSSVQRGGMFEVFASNYGSACLADIKRQDSNWGRAVAMAFSKGEIRSGVEILQKHDRIIKDENKSLSIKSLLNDWSKSDQSIQNKLIIAIKNSDVNALNLGARQILKDKGQLKGQEFAVGIFQYMQGDRILITQTSKELGLNNGDLLDITEVTNELFIAKDALGKEVSFNPKEYKCFKHGYATTVFKAQGASIGEVFVLHEGFSTIRNSYVSLSRNITDLKLYINNQATKSYNHLIKQLSFDPDSGSSLEYYTKSDLDKKKLDSNFNTQKGVFVSMLVGTLEYGLKKITEFTDKKFALREYYNFKVLDKKDIETKLDNTPCISEQIKVITEIHNQSQFFAAVGSDISNNYSENIINGNVDSKLSLISNNKKIFANLLGKQKVSAKERFYAKAEYSRNINNKSRDNISKEKWEAEMNQLRSEIRFKSELVVKDLLGEPNKKLSNGKTLRYGENGKLAVRINGERAGTWYDFSSDQGGDIFKLIQEHRGGNFKDSADYLKNLFGIEANNFTSLKLVHDHRNSDLTEKYHKEKLLEQQEVKRKKAQVDKLVLRTEKIDENSLASEYLVKHRGIDCSAGDDIKTASIFIKEKNCYLPALIAFTRDKQGNITGGQQIILDSKTGSKANIDVPKKSFGKIAGSFVHLGSLKEASKINSEFSLTLNREEVPQITIIAEGLETALSVKQVLSKEYVHFEKSIEVLCSLGISNINNYQAKKGEKIIIAADNDGAEAISNKTINSAKIILETKGAFAEVVRPNIKGDFNDLLLLGKEKEISNAFKDIITKHTANTLQQYLTICNKIEGVDNFKLDNITKEHLTYIHEYKLPEKNIVEAYRQSGNAGVAEIEQTRKTIEFAANNFKRNIDVLSEANQWGFVINKIEVTKAMYGLNEQEADKYCVQLHNSQLEQYFNKNLQKFSQQKFEVNDLEKLKSVIKAEQEFLKKTYQSLKLPITERSNNIIDNIKAGEMASKHPELSGQVFDLARTLVDKYKEPEAGICREIAGSINIKEILIKLDKTIEFKKIKETLSELDKQIKAAISPIQTIDSLNKKDEFIISLKNNIKYPDVHNKELIQSIEAIDNIKQSSNNAKLNKLTLNHIAKSKINNEEILQLLKRASNTNKALEDLTKHYQQFVIEDLKKCLKGIDEGKSIKLNNQSFNCKIKFLEHILDKHQHNEFLPKQNILKAYNNIVNRQKEVHLFKGLNGMEL